MHIFYINLAARTDRRDFMERQAARLGLTMERVEAITPADIPEDEIAAAARWLGKGELACSYSHRSVWRMIVERGLSAALVLEDDCMLAPQIAKVLDDPELLAPNIQMLQMETHPSSGMLGRPFSTAAPGITKRRMMSSCLGTCGYVITPGLARQCIDHADLPRMDLGKFLFSRNGPGLLYHHRVFQAFPALATPIGALIPDTEMKRSDIDHTRRKRNPALATPTPPRRSPGNKMANTFRHVARSIKAFGISELVAARHLPIPFAGTASQAQALLDEVSIASR